MSIFQLYLKLGLQHILNWAAFDHLLFLLVLSAPYSLKSFKKVLWLATAFTVGHTITLFASTTQFVHISIAWIEFLIPFTILITAFANLFELKHKKPFANWLSYFITLIFGFIHGLGFSNYLKAMLSQEESIIKPLFAFNIGIEIGQIMVVFLLLLLHYLFIKLKNSRVNYWNLSFSIFSGIWAVILMSNRLPF